MKKHRECNPYYRVKVRLFVNIVPYYRECIDRLKFNCATKEQADAKKAEVEEILAKAIRRECETFTLGSGTYRSEVVFAYTITIKEPDPMPEFDEDYDD